VLHIDWAVSAATEMPLSPPFE